MWALCVSLLHCMWWFAVAEKINSFLNWLIYWLIDWFIDEFVSCLCVVRMTWSVRASISSSTWMISLSLATVWLRWLRDLCRASVIDRLIAATSSHAGFKPNAVRLSLSLSNMSIRVARLGAKLCQMGYFWQLLASRKFGFGALRATFWATYWITSFYCVTYKRQKLGYFSPASGDVTFLKKSGNSGVYMCSQESVSDLQSVTCPVCTDDHALSKPYAGKPVLTPGGW